MNKKIGLWISLLSLTALSGAISCGGASPSGGGGGGGRSAAVASVEITNCPSQLALGSTQNLNVVAKDAQGNVLGQISFVVDSDAPHIASVSNQVLSAEYPGEASLLATAEGVDSAPCAVTVPPPQNSKTVKALTDNLDEDHWGQNNNWKTLSRGKVLWQTVLPSTEVEVWLGDVSGSAKRLTTVPGGDVDFMALGGGASAQGVLATWREDLSNTFASDGLNMPVPLGALTQEENSVADGCLYFRKGLPENDIVRFSMGAGVSTPGTTGDLYGPITSGCKAVWEQREVGGSTLVYFDGTQATPIANGLPNFPSYDFREGRAVYALGGDIYLYDANEASPQSVNLTNQSSFSNASPKTDGHSLVYLRKVNGNDEVVLYDFVSKASQVISTTPDLKTASTLQIDQKQVIWKEGSDLYFFDGTTTALVNSAPATEVNQAHLADGRVVWHSPTGPMTDSEIFVME